MTTRESLLALLVVIASAHGAAQEAGPSRPNPARPKPDARRDRYAEGVQAVRRGGADHLSEFGIALKERMDELGIECIVQYEGQPSARRVSVADFLRKHLAGDTALTRRVALRLCLGLADRGHP